MGTLIKVAPEPLFLWIADWFGICTEPRDWLGVWMKRQPGLVQSQKGAADWLGSGRSKKRRGWILETFEK